MSNINLPKQAENDQESCLVKDFNGYQCILVGSHWPWAHINKYGQKWMIIKGAPVLTGIDFCQSSTPNGDPCTLPIGHEGTHHYDERNFQPNIVIPPEDKHRCAMMNAEGARCVLVVGHGTAHSYEYRSPNEPEHKAPPEPFRKLHITTADSSIGLIILECTPEVADIIRSAKLGELMAHATQPHGYALSVADTLFDFAGVVDWLNTLA